VIPFFQKTWFLWWILATFIIRFVRRRRLAKCPIQAKRDPLRLEPDSVDPRAIWLPKREHGCWGRENLGAVSR
jgi:hypothetical protein